MHIFDIRFPSHCLKCIEMSKTAMRLLVSWCFWQQAHKSSLWLTRVVRTVNTLNDLSPLAPELRGFAQPCWHYLIYYRPTANWPKSTILTRTPMLETRYEAPTHVSNTKVNSTNNSSSTVQQLWARNTVKVVFNDHIVQRFEDWHCEQLREQYMKQFVFR